MNGLLKTRIGATLMVLGLALVAAPAAGAAWTPPEDLSASGAGSPILLPQANDQATVIWRQDGVVTASRLGPDGAALTTTPLSGASATLPDADVAPDGAVSVVWMDAGVGKTVRIAPDGTPGEVKSFATPADGGTDQPQVAVAPDGVATIIWQSEENFGTLRFTRVATDGTLSSAGGETLATGGINRGEIAVGPDGEATVGFADRLNQQRAVAIQISPSGDPGSELTLHSDDQVFGDPNVTVDSDGVATVVYSVNDGGQSVKARRISASGTLGSELGVASANSNGPLAQVDEDDVVTVAWRDGANTIISGRLINDDGTLGTAGALSASGTAAGGPSLSVLPGGGVTAAWVRNGKVEVGRPPAAGALPTAETVVSTDTGADQPRVANAPDGTSDAVWLQSGALKISVLDDTDPVIDAFSAPASAFAGARYSVSSSPTDARSGIDAIVWDFGDGSSSSGSPNADHAYFVPGTYTVKLTVTDRAGNETEQSGQVTVTPPPPPAPPGAGGGGGGAGSVGAKKCKKKKKGKKRASVAKKKKSKKCKKKKRKKR